MKKLIFTLFTTIMTITGMAQTIGEAFYIYRNDGQFNAFLRDEVDSIAYSYYGVDSLFYDEIVTQIVYTVDSIYKIPLASIDSVSFATPETKYTPQVVKMEPLLPYIVGVDGMKLTFSSDIPSNLFPKKDDVLVLDKFDYEQFPAGFAGRMLSKDGLQIICDSVSFEDIYEHFLCYGYYTAVNDNNDSENSRVRFVAKRRVGGNISKSVQVKGTLGSTGTGLYASVDGRIGLDLRFTFKYNTGEPVYYDISLTPELSFNLEAGAKGSFSAPLDLDVPLLVMPIPDSPFYFKLSGGPVWESSLEASVVVKTDAKLGYRFGVKYENGSYKWDGGNTSKWFSKPEITGNMKGSAFIGLQLETGIYSYGNIVSTTIEKKAGAEFEASISENIQNPDSYNDLQNGYLDVNLKASADFKAEAKLFKWLKLSAKYNILSGKVNIYKFKLVPTFTKPSVSLEKSSAIVSVIPNEDLIFPVSIGLGLWNNNNVMLDTQFCEGTYSDRDSWPLNEYRILFPNLVPNTDYTVRPLVKLFGGTIVAPPEETFKISVTPITLDVYDIEETTAKVYGRIDNYELLDESIKYGIGYTTESEIGETSFGAMDYYGGGVFSVNLMALKPNTTYNYFAYLEINGETYYGEIKQFTTKDNVIGGEDTSDYEAYMVREGYTLIFYYDNKRKERDGIRCNSQIKQLFTFISKLEKVIFNSSFAKFRPTYFSFYGCKDLISIENIQYLDTSNITDMSHMFDLCYSLRNLDLKNFNTSNVKNMYNMFGMCKTLKSLDLSSFNTANVTDMEGMFYVCSSLTSLDLGNFNTTNVTDMGLMFHSCSSLSSINVSSFNTTNVTDMAGMFYGCSSLTNLDVSCFNTANVTRMVDMFNRCSSLQSLDLNNFYTNNIICMDCMFYKCSSLKTIYAGNWNIGDRGSSMFDECNNLVGGKGTKIGKNIYGYDKNDKPLYYYCSSSGPAAHIDGGKDNPGLFTAK